MNPNTDYTPAALYARAASDRQDVDLSVSPQLRALRDYAQKNGYIVAVNTWTRPRAVASPTAPTRSCVVSLPAQSECEHDFGHRLHDAAVRESIVSDRPTILLQHHLKELRLPTFSAGVRQDGSAVRSRGSGPSRLPAQTG